MSLLFKIIYATHANGTHHKLALDALRHLETAQSENWTRVFLKHAEVYMQGSKAPDTEFKDFKNHVLHVRDGYWGGAPEKAQNWYTHVVEALQASDWERAVYAAGVLTHYVTDPIHPFHTAQTAAENNIHRAVEWSINRSYDSLRQEAEQTYANVVIAPTEGPHWLKDLVCQGADTSNKSYEKLIAHYDIHRGVVNPPEGLDGIARAAVAELLMVAAKTVARVLDRAIAESGVTPPEVSLTVESVLATLKIPLKFVTKKLEDAATRRQVEAMYDELKATGRVEANLPEDDRTVRDLHAAEVLAPQAAKQAAVRSARLPATAAAGPAPAFAKQRPPPPAARAGEPITQRRVLLKQDQAAKVPELHAKAAVAPEMAAPAASIAEIKTVAAGAPIVAADANPGASTVRASAPATPPTQIGLSQLSKSPRLRLALKDNLEAAPSIGPKMAERFAALGITTVGDFVEQDASVMADLLDDTRFSADTLLDWQQQAHMVMAIPGLTGTQAQLFTGAGFKSAAGIAAADPADLSAAILAFASSTEGKRILRDGNAPDLEKIKSIVTTAVQALAA